MKMLLAEVEVTKVASNSARDFIRVHIFSRHLIKKRRIYELEKMIKEQLFGTVCGEDGQSIFLYSTAANF